VVNAPHGVAAHTIAQVYVQSGPPPIPPPELPTAGLVAVPARLSNLPIGEQFFGRSRELSALAEAMQTGTEVVTHAVLGLGGIGKSSLVAAYCRRYGTSYIGMWWLTADSRIAAEAGLADLARRLHPPASSHPDPTVLVQWTLSWLGQHPGMLLVWDNVEDVEVVRDLIAALPGTAHLITSRRAGRWHRIGVTEPLRLEPLDPVDAVDLLNTLGGAKSAGPAAEQLCEELGYLPLAIEQAGAYLAEASISITEYLASWRGAQAAITWAPEMSEADRIMTGVWRATLDKLVDTPIAGNLLRVMAWLAPEAVPVLWLAEAVEDAAAAREALRRLNAYSMITLYPNGTVGVHRVVQAVTRTPDPDDQHRKDGAILAAQHTAALILAAHLPDGDPLDPVVARQWRTALPHVDFFATYAIGREIPFLAIVVMDRTVAFWRAHGNPAAAVQIAVCLLSAAEQHFGPTHLDTLRSRNSLATAYESAGDLARAIPLFETALDDLVQVVGPDHPETLTCRNNLAGVYESAGDLVRAIPLYETTVADCERVLGPDDPSTLSASNNLAYAYASAGAFDLAIPLHEATLGKRTRALGPDHPHTLTSLSNLAGAYESVGNPAKAIPLHETTLATRSRRLGPDHPDTLASRNNLATALQAAGDHDRAISLFESLVIDCQRVLGPDHPSTLSTCNNLAHAYFSTGDVAKAIPLYETNLVARTRVLGPDHPATLTSGNNLAGAYEKAGDLARAIPLYEATLTRCERVLGPNHPRTKTVRENLTSARP
jgi:tetratricopeptide (TPR) repeat protein